MILFLVSLLGLIAGYILSFITPEEVMAGKKQLSFFRYFLLLSITVCAIFYLQNLLFSLIFVFLTLSFVFLQQKFKSRYWEIAFYAIFLLTFLVLGRNLLFVSLVFLYGLPTGSLLRGLKNA